MLLVGTRNIRRFHGQPVLGTGGPVRPVVVGNLNPTHQRVLTGTVGVSPATEPGTHRDISTRVGERNLVTPLRPGRRNRVPNIEFENVRGVHQARRQQASATGPNSHKTSLSR